MTSENPTPFQRGTRVYPLWKRPGSMDISKEGAQEYLVLGVVYTLAGGLRVVIENIRSGSVSVQDPRTLSLQPRDSPSSWPSSRSWCPGASPGAGWWRSGRCW